MDFSVKPVLCIIEDYRKKAAVDVPVITYPRTGLLFLGTSSGTKARSLTPHCRC
jgi:hypothetical protein